MIDDSSNVPQNYADYFRIEQTIIHTRKYINIYIHT